MGWYQGAELCPASESIPYAVHSSGIGLEAVAARLKAVDAAEQASEPALGVLRRLKVGSSLLEEFEEVVRKKEAAFANAHAISSKAEALW